MDRWSLRVDPPWSFDAWRVGARLALQCAVPPDQLDWLQGAEASLLDAPALRADHAPAASTDAATYVSRAFVELAATCLCHSDPQRMSLLYRMLWRIAGGERALLSNPADVDVLSKLMEGFPKAPRKLAAQVWQALITPLADEAEAPLALPANDANKQALKRLQDAVSARSAELGLPDGVLASRKHLESYIERRQWPTALAGWRQAQLEPILAPLLPPA